MNSGEDDPHHLPLLRGGLQEVKKSRWMPPVRRKSQATEHHPANFGRLCSKGAALGETLSLDDRLLYPEIAGRRATWDEALDAVAAGFRQTLAEHGPDAGPSMSPASC